MIAGTGFIGGCAILKQGSTVLARPVSESPPGLGTFDGAVVISLSTFVILKLLTRFKEDQGPEHTND